jgi:DNA-binding transcriptional MerR regulator
MVVVKKMSELFSISQVCKLIKTTSRTLRYYEEMGIISSIHNARNIPRQYTAEQIDQIKKVFVLRSLGLSVNSIRELIQKNKDLTAAIHEKRKHFTQIGKKLAVYVFGFFYLSCRLPAFFQNPAAFAFDEAFDKFKADQSRRRHRNLARRINAQVYIPDALTRKQVLYFLPVKLCFVHF